MQLLLLSQAAEPFLIKGAFTNILIHVDPKSMSSGSISVMRFLKVVNVFKELTDQKVQMSPLK